jgi:hypothetical protein
MSKKRKINKGEKKLNEPFWLKHPYLIIFAVAFIVHIRAAGFDFVNIDDDEIILGKYDKISSLSNVPEAFTSQYGFKESTPYYRPIINLSFFLDAQISGKNPGGYHVSNIIYHLITVSLLFMLMLKFGLDKSISLFVSILFMVHPLLTNAIDWIAGRNDLIAGLFCLLSFIYFLKYLTDFTNKNLYLHSLFYLLGIFSKESVLVLPAACLFYFYLFERRKITKKILLKLAVIWLIPIIGSQLLKGVLIHSIGNVTYGLSALLDNFRVIPEVISKVFIPLEISVLPTFSLVKTILGTAILIIILLFPVFVRSIDKKKFYFGVFWFFLFLLPGLLVVYSNQGEGFDYLDTRDYIPVMGIMLSLGTVLSTIKLKTFNLKYMSTGLAVLILLSILTVIQSNKYQNGAVFAENAVESNPGRPFFYQKLADYYFVHADYNKAIEYLRQAIRIEPNAFIFYKNLALAYLHLKQRENAVPVLEKAYELNDKDRDVLNALVRTNYELHNFKESFYYLNKVIELGGKVDQHLYETLKALEDKKE